LWSTVAGHALEQSGPTLGALLGVALAAAMGSRYSRNTGAESQIQIVRNCMAGRGYRVLN